MQLELTSNRTGTKLEEIRAGLKRLERRDWWLWSVSVVIMLLLTTAVVGSSLSAFLREDVPVFEKILNFDITQAVRSLVGLVLIFNTYAIYQHITIRRLRRELAEQLQSMAKLELRAERYYQLAAHDPLTGLANRHSGDERLKAEIARARRYGHSLTVLIIDLNNFKQINDRYGHPAGDMVLREFAERLKKASRGSDLPVRMGGDEFILLLPECLPSQVPHVLVRLAGLEVEFGQEKIPVTFSAGWAEYQSGEEPDELIKRADQALYADKYGGNVEEQIRQAQKMQTVGQLAGGVAHDLANLLMLIKSYADLAVDQFGQEDLLHGNLEQVQKAADRATALIEQLLAFSRRRELKPEVMDLNVVVADIDQMLRRLIGGRIKVTSSLCQVPGYVKADRGQVEQIILNLAINARDAMPGGGTLTIETANVELDEGYVRNHPGARAGSYVMLTVRDTGCGMDAETLAHIFEPFFTTKKDKGTGLGLATVYGIVKQSGGYIWAGSELERGSEFTVYLPRVKEAVEAVTPPRP